MHHLQKKICCLIAAVLTLGMLASCVNAQESGTDPALDQLNEFAAMVREEEVQSFGYPGNQNVQLTEFYKWLIDSGLDTAIVNNAGDR